eukprot:Protomagalhaensia_wolfi_Nauph_80__6233@NODE_93_length_3785_cov_36_400427_g70_i0_p2_GENE_NODE_93_length_3785_cov_36_400427_g70_i0NODE_93_length_3785_cov_36_400427_g70_i0_p2_ORF_typecomplete_len348_score39_63SIP1/PF04938_12/0_46_NODE_93_length_3785_cov_36_400427_g70_i015352578
MQQFSSDQIKHAAGTAATYLLQVRQERQRIKLPAVTVATEGCPASNKPPDYLTSLLKLHRQDQAFESQCSSHPLALTTLQLLQLQNRKVRAAAILKEKATLDQQVGQISTTQNPGISNPNPFQQPHKDHPSISHHPPPAFNPLLDESDETEANTSHEFNITNTQPSPAVPDIPTVLTITHQLPTPNNLRIGHSVRFQHFLQHFFPLQPSALRVLSLLAQLGESGAVPSLGGPDAQTNGSAKVDFKHWTTWLLAALQCVDPLCLCEPEHAHTIRRLSRLLQQAMGSREEAGAVQDTMDERLIATESVESSGAFKPCFLSESERSLVPCLGFALVNLSKGVHWRPVEDR